MLIPYSNLKRRTALRTLSEPTAVPTSVSNWIIVYRTVGEHVEILHIWDGPRDLPRR